MLLQKNFIDSTNLSSIHCSKKGFSLLQTETKANVQRWSSLRKHSFENSHQHSEIGNLKKDFTCCIFIDSLLSLKWNLIPVQDDQIKTFKPRERQTWSPITINSGLNYFITWNSRQEYKISTAISYVNTKYWEKNMLVNGYHGQNQFFVHTCIDETTWD